MPWSRKSKPKAERVVRHKLRDGSVREYRYATYNKSATPKNRSTLSGLIYDYQNSPQWRVLAARTQWNYAHYLKAFDKMEEIDPAAIKRRNILPIYNAIAAARGNGAATGFLYAAKALFSWAVEQDLLEYSPVTKIKPLPLGELLAWEQGEAVRAIAKLPEPFRRVVVLALYTGQRRGDLCAMGWSAYDGASIRLVQQKTGTAMVLPVHPDLKAELDRWERKATTILTNPRGTPWKPGRLSDQLPRRLRALGLRDGLNVHGLRKLAAANLAEAGCSTHEIAAITGHKTLAMIELYTKSASQRVMATAAIVRLSGGKRNG